MTERELESSAVTSSTEDSNRPVFYYDLGSPYSYLAAERVNRMLPVVPVWQPILLGGIYKITGGRTWALTADRAAGMAEVERRAADYGLPPIRWPEPWPADMLTAMRAATFAQRAGRAVAFSLAAFRQAFAGGRDLSDPDSVLIAAAACELHPAAVLKAVDLRATREALRSATERAGAAGVRSVPAVRVGGELFAGDAALELAARAAT